MKRVKHSRGLFRGSKHYKWNNDKNRWNKTLAFVEQVSPPLHMEQKLSHHSCGKHNSAHEEIE
jgi:hypothetical protein